MGRPRKIIPPPFYDPNNLQELPNPPTFEALQQYAEYLEKRTHNYPQPQPRPYQWKSGILTRNTYYLSSRSKAGLYKLARQYQYGHDLGNRQANISSFIRALANPDIEWSPERPQYLIDMDHLRITNGKMPLWIDPDERQPRIHLQFYLTESVKDYFLRLAQYHMIYPPNLRSSLPDGPVLSYLFEVIGANALVPHNVPMNPNPAKKYYPPQKHTYDYSI